MTASLMSLKAAGKNQNQEGINQQKWLQLTLIGHPRQRVVGHFRREHGWSSRGINVHIILP